MRSTKPYTRYHSVHGEKKYACKDRRECKDSEDPEGEEDQVEPREEKDHVVSEENQDRTESREKSDHRVKGESKG